MDHILNIVNGTMTVRKPQLNFNQKTKPTENLGSERGEDLMLLF